MLLPVVGAIALWIVAAVLIASGDQEPSWALSSNVIYRLAFGAIFAAAAYIAFVALALAWQGQAFTKLSVGPVAIESPALVSAAQELDELALRADSQAGRLRASLDEVADFLDDVAHGLGGLAEDTAMGFEALGLRYERLKEGLNRLEALHPGAPEDAATDPHPRQAEA